MFGLKGLIDLFRFLARGSAWGLVLGLLFLGGTIWAVDSMFAYMQIRSSPARLLTAVDLRNYEDLSPLETVLVEGSISNRYQRYEGDLSVHYALLTTTGGSFVAMSETSFAELEMPLNGRFESRTEPQFMQVRQLILEQSQLERLPITFFIVGSVPQSNIVVYALTGFTTTSLAVLGIGSFLLKKLGRLPS